MSQPIICIRGLMRDQRHWGDFLDELQKALPGQMILPLDIPGNGRRYREDSLTSIEDNVNRLRLEISQKTDITKAHLVGISMGGIIALEWANQHPEEVCSVTMINSSIGNFSKFYQRLIWNIYPKLIWSLLFSSYTTLERRILSYISNFKQNDRKTIEQWVDWARQLPVSRLNIVRQLMAAGRYKIENKPPIPLLILSSKNDRLVDSACSETVAKAWPDTVHIQHESAGHDIPLDSPKWLLEHLSDWIFRNNIDN